MSRKRRQRIGTNAASPTRSAILDPKLYIPALISFCALFVSISSCRNSSKSVEIAQAVRTETAKRFNIQTQPVFKIVPWKFLNNTYWDQWTEGSSIIAWVQFRIENIGDTEAVHFHLTEKPKFTFPVQKVDLAVNNTEPINLTIAPQDPRFIRIPIKLNYQDAVTAEQELTKLRTGSGLQTKVQLTFEYNTEIYPEEIYRVTSEFTIMNDRVIAER